MNATRATRFGRYWLHERIGHGGMAEVHRATIGPDPATYAFDFAVKRLRNELAKDPSQVDMFLTEADIAKFLLHPNIVRVYESGSLEGQPYIAMEYVWGLELGQLLARLRHKRLRLPTDLAVHVAMQVLRGLDYVHRARSPGGEPMEMVHRDVTPSNIYVTYRGEVKLGDFGVARVKFLEGQDEQRLLKGKVAYMPPEVLVGHPVDSTSDVWALSVTLYEMVTGRRAFEGVPEEALLAGQAARRLVPAHKVNPDIDLELSAILSEALHKNPRRRPMDAVDLYRELKIYLRHQGVQLDAGALGRFVHSAAGPTPELPVPRGPASSGSFPVQGYQSPMGASPTQQLELRARRNRWLKPLLVTLGVGAAVGVGWLLGRLG